MSIPAPIFFLPGSRDWYLEPRSWRDVLRCCLGLHRPIMQATVGNLTIARCSCGGIRLAGLWSETNKVGLRRPGQNHR